VAQGFLPLTLHPGTNADFVHLDAEKPLHLHAAAQPQAFFWDTLADWTGIILREPSLKLNLAGTWQAPRGEVDLRAQAFQFRKARFPMPSLESLQLTVQLDAQQARLTEGQVLIQGQSVSLTGEFPLDQSFWASLKAKKLPDWTKARARLRIANAELAAFEPLFPGLLSPQGELNADLSLLPGGKWDGTLAVHHARTRPLGNLGPARDIEVNVRLLDRTLKLENATANLSGATVTLTGQADLHGTNWLTGNLPPMSFALSGTDVPLARQPNLIVRSDLNLAVAKTNGAPPLISGIARLKDSYFLSDLQALVPARIALPSQRPPYFSIEDPLLADWRLALQVNGVRFLKIRSPIFNGEISTSLRLQGTLKDPIALGDVKTDSGVVSFPFASLQVQQGLVTLTSQDPYRPQLAVSATSKQFGYDIRMEVTGSADAPVIQFSSTPPLSSEQILLMVTAGEMPQGTFTLTSQQRAETVALFFGRDLLVRLGLSDQAQQRLTIRSGEQISEQGRPTYHVEYKLNGRWSLEGEYDRFGDFNAGFKWRIYSK
jgi:translocation and assembly module TamB